ncbi:DUF4304 domain-containing protein [Dactylosporangium sp. McL0621]|uniref:DUF4304 domain-containing protein n=1 Tax=Dactylosporangium sp. McL0621 TaxID=3415678 RepID=UPI003CF9F48D
MPSDVRRACRQMLANQVAPWLRERGFTGARGVFRRLGDDGGVELEFQNSSYPWRPSCRRDSSAWST